MQVDAFELAVETPPAAGAPADRRQVAEEGGRTPQRGDGQQGVARALAAAAPTPGTAMRQRAMSLGLSRRRSSAVPWPVHTALASSSKANQSPLKLSMRPGAAAQRWAHTEVSIVSSLLHLRMHAYACGAAAWLHDAEPLSNTACACASCLP